MIDFAKSSDFTNESSRFIWAKLIVGDTKLIVKKSNKKGSKKESYSAKIIGKNYSHISILRLDNDRVESIHYSDLLQDEVELYSFKTC